MLIRGLPVPPLHADGGRRCFGTQPFYVVNGSSLATRSLGILKVSKVGRMIWSLHPGPDCSEWKTVRPPLRRAPRDSIDHEIPFLCGELIRFLIEAVTFSASWFGPSGLGF